MDEKERLKSVYRSYATDGDVSRRFSKDNRGNQIIVKERMDSLGVLLNKRGLLPLGDRRILEVGCGAASTLARLVPFGARPENLFGIDLMVERIAIGKRWYPNFRLFCMNASQVGFASGSFDIVAAFAVFSSIFDQTLAVAVGAEILRVLKPHGIVLWYDIRYPSLWNRNVRPISKRDIQTYFPGTRLDLDSLTVLPPVARLLPAAYPLLKVLPVFRSHWFGIIEK